MTKTSTRKSAAATRRCLIGARDIEILAALHRCPLTAEQLLRISQTFSLPFTGVSNLRRRLRRLAAADYVRSWPYAVATSGRSPHYFRLGRAGYAVLYGHEATPPKRRQFEAISSAHHHHTFCMAEFLTHTIALANQSGCCVEEFTGENEVILTTEPFTLIPDCTFVIRTRDSRPFRFMVEIDNATERVRSKLDVESIERKLRGYDAHQSQFDKFDPQRYLVIFVTTRSERRLQHILDLAGEVMKQPQRRVFVGTTLQTFLVSNPFTDAVLQDHRGLRRTLVPMISTT